ncbi:thioesterase family protein [Gordonia alkaliphila]|uniref:thioesterase family protein n=1 Tax=Gordonia alkaliphila TaxID=1053547 RepID=UPI001FF0F99D|nr:thioesterase family protein [Gordonia alkaliphila]MCK0440729.1 thioesterase family protein [Gordonia alkaliphila]
MATILHAEEIDVTAYRAYYEPLERPAGDPEEGEFEYFRPTAATVSVWSSALQHGGPPTGLLVRTMEHAVADQSSAQDFSRVTMEILGAIGLGVCRVRAHVSRPGRQISQVTAEMQEQQGDGSFRTVARATTWRLSTRDTRAVETAPHPVPAQTPDELPRTVGFTGADGIAVAWGRIGFIGTLEIAITAGRTGSTPTVWTRPLLPLVEGEELSDLASAMTVIDIANGVGSPLDPTQWSWMNTDTTVHLTNAPRGPWIGIDAALAAGGSGYGASFADLYDTTGFVGRSAQTVLIAPQ